MPYQNKRLYLSIRIKFIISTFFALSWATLSFFLARFWLKDLIYYAGPFAAYFLITFIALLPGFLNAHLLMSLILDSPPPLDLEIDYPPVSILIASYNDAKNLYETFRSLRQQDYPAYFEIIVVDDGSSDESFKVLRELKTINVKIFYIKHGGKARALSEGLKHVRYPLLVTIDADTYLHPQALRRIVARILSDPPNTGAVAGHVLVKNSRVNLLAKAQEWDYFTGISSVKRQQSLYRGTMVAQGSFSIFFTKLLRIERGWPVVVGEDIVLTWALIKDGYRIGFEPTAIGFTVTPLDLKNFYHQRKRWARGMIEGLKRYGATILKEPKLPSFFILIDFILPTIDFFYTFAFLPGIILALTGRFFIVGPISLFVLPLLFLIVLTMYLKEKKIFKLLNLKIRRNFLGLFVYMFLYQIIVSPIAVVGYFQAFFTKSGKEWK